MTEQLPTSFISKSQDFRMSTVEIAKLTGKRHDHVFRDTRQMLVELYGENNLPNFGEVYNDSKNRTYQCYSLQKNDILTLVSGYSISLRAKIIRRLDALESEKQASGLSSLAKDQFELGLKGLSLVKDALKISDVSYLGLVHKHYEGYKLPTNALPEYIENVRVTFSATELLKKNQCKIGVRAFNQLMISSGYMEKKERPSKSKGVKKFKALTESGLEYGQNDVSPSNPLETQSHYFEDTFMVLYGILTDF